MKDKLEERFNSIEESIEDNKETNTQQLNRLDSIEDTTATNSARIQVLENDKAKKVLFSAYNNEGGAVTGHLKFPKVVTNLGSGFDASTGVFTAPIKGVYTFSFSGQQSANPASSRSSYIDIYVKKNGTTIFKIFSGPKDYTYYNI